MPEALSLKYMGTLSGLEAVRVPLGDRAWWSGFCVLLSDLDSPTHLAGRVPGSGCQTGESRVALWDLRKGSEGDHALGLNFTLGGDEVMSPHDSCGDEMGNCSLVD